MKKLFIFIFLLLLVGCEEKNIIQVNRMQDGFKSELVASLKRNDADDFLFYACEVDTYCVNRYYDGGKQEHYEVNLLTKEVKEISEDEYKNNNEQVFHETDDYKIIYKSESRLLENGNGYYSYNTYYLEEDGKRYVLYEGKSTWNDSYEYSHCLTGTHPVLKEYVFMIKEEDKISIKKIEDKKLVEVDSFPLIKNGYTLYNYYRTQDGFVYRYDNEEEILLIENGKETVYKKILEDGSTLMSFDYDSAGPKLYYEGDEVFHYIENEVDTIIEKEVDGYKFREVNFSEKNIITYTKDGNMRIVIDEKGYDLGYVINHIITDDFIFATIKDMETKEYQTIYVNLVTEEKYILSEPIDMGDVFNYGEFLVVKGYANSNSIYSIIKIDETECTVIELPFPAEFHRDALLDKNHIVFAHETKDGLDLYVVEIE